MKRLLLLVTVFLLVVFPVVKASGTESPRIQVFVNGQPLESDSPPTVVSGRTLVPLRAIFETLGAEVRWDATTRTAMAQWVGGKLSLTVGATTAWVNGEERVLDVPGQIIQDRTMVPLRFVAEAMGAQVGWYGHSRIITINVASLDSATVTRVHRADSVQVKLANGSEATFHLRSVDILGWGDQATTFVKARLSGQTVQLEYDDQGHGDRYGYLYLPGGAMFNAILMDEGYAKPDTTSDRYSRVFAALQWQAKAAVRGQWSQQTPVPDLDLSNGIFENEELIAYLKDPAHPFIELTSKTGEELFILLSSDGEVMVYSVDRNVFLKPNGFVAEERLVEILIETISR